MNDLPLAETAILKKDHSIPRKLLWQKSLSNLITEPKELLQLLQLPLSLLPEAEAAAKLFPLKATREFVSRINKSDVADPLLKQILPLGLELHAQPGYSADPLQEAKALKVSGLLHKYHGRVLLIFSSSCAIHCRYCFRREFPYAENRMNIKAWQPALDYIQQHTEITEVILSGGDPLVMKDEFLQQFLHLLAAIKHVKRLRIHSRLPVVLPDRITPELIQVLANSGLATVVVIHSNHAQELDHSVATALQALRSAGVLLLNQAVLMQGINDSVSVLKQLSEQLFTLGVLPYYLHLLDPVNGTHHFNVPIAAAKQLQQQLQAVLPGYLVPKLVQELPGQFSKTVV